MITPRHGVLRLPQPPLGIVARSTCDAMQINRARLAAHWDVLAFAALAIVFAILVARPFEIGPGRARRPRYANTGFAIARYRRDRPVRCACRADRARSKTRTILTLRAAAAQAETNFLGVQDPRSLYRHAAARRWLFYL